MAPELERRLLSRSPEATEALGEALGRCLVAGSAVALSGELGAGKTCFVRGLARGLGVVDLVASPTYTLMHEYEGRLPLYHFDAWMSGREQAFLESGGAEWLHADGVAVVEWAERVEGWLPAPRLSVSLAHRGERARGLRLALVAGAGGPEAQELARILAQIPLPEGIFEEAPGDARGAREGR